MIGVLACKMLLYNLVKNALVVFRLTGLEGYTGAFRIIKAFTVSVRCTRTKHIVGIQNKALI